MRLEKDTLGEIKVPSDALWGGQTQRAILNFNISKEVIPLEIVYALVKIKKAAALINYKLGNLNKNKLDLINKATSEILKGKFNNQFPLKVWQTGSGTNTNMNVNEVISNIASLHLGESLGTYKSLHPNDDVNKSQSTNDTFPSSIQIAVVEEINKRLLPENEKLINTLENKIKDWNDIIKLGRTHLQDAVPLTLSQEISAWKDQLLTANNRIKKSLEELYYLPLGGTALGTGLNTPKNFDLDITTEIASITGLPFKSSQNKFALMSSHDGLVNTMGCMKMLAISLFKIVNDVRLLSCGPRGGINELIIPAQEPGSSIMPGKVNPTQCESMTMVCNQIIGFDLAVSLAGSGGQLQMNAYKPLIAFNLLKSIELLSDSLRSCRTLMFQGMRPNKEIIKTNLDNSLMLVTSLAPKIGYKKASEIAQYAYDKNISLKKAALKLGYISEVEFDEIVNPSSMANPHK